MSNVRVEADSAFQVLGDHDADPSPPGKVQVHSRRVGTIAQSAASFQASTSRNTRSTWRRLSSRNARQQLSPADAPGEPKMKYQSPKL